MTSSYPPDEKSYRVNLTRSEADRAELILEDTRLVRIIKVGEESRQEEWSFKRYDVASRIFEHHLNLLSEEGFQLPPSKLPSAPSQKEGEDLDSLATFAEVFKDGEKLYADNLICIATAAWVYDDDVVSLTDGSSRDLFEGLPHLPPGKFALFFKNKFGFALPKGLEWINTYALHRLRRLLDNPVAASLTSLRLLLIEKNTMLSSYLDLLEHFGRAEVLTHLMLYGDDPDSALASLIERLPQVRALTCHASLIDHILTRPVPNLKSLTLIVSEEKESRLPRAELLPSLKHLGLRAGRMTEKDWNLFINDPLLPQLESLDLWAIFDHGNFPFEALLGLKKSLSHLKHIIVSGGRVEEGIRRAFSDWPAVRLVADRREILSWDLATTGWPSNI